MKIEFVGNYVFMWCSNRDLCTVVDKHLLPSVDRAIKGITAWRPTPTSTWYVIARLRDGRRVYLHRWLLGEPTGRVVDHENHNGLDNRLENLSATTIAKNVWNRTGAQRNNRSSGVRGVSRVTTRSTVKGKTYSYERWEAYYTINGKRTCVGRFHHKADAQRAVELARSQVS